MDLLKDDIDKVSEILIICNEEEKAKFEEQTINIPSITISAPHEIKRKFLS